MKKLAKRISSRVKRLYSKEERLESLVGPPGAWKLTEKFPLEFLQSQGLASSDTLLEIGCGVLRVGTHLINYLEPNGYAGVDIRSEVIDISHELVAENKLGSKNPALITSEKFGAEYFQDKRFNYVIAFQVLYHLSDDIVEDCFLEVAKRLSSNSKFYANVSIGEEADGSWREFPFVKRPFDFYESLGKKYKLKMDILGTLEEFGYSKNLGGHRNHMLMFTQIPDLK